MSPRRLTLAAVLLAAAGALADAPATQPTAGLTVKGADGVAHAMSPADLAALPRKTLHVIDHDGSQADYEGVLVREVLLKVGVPLGQKRLKGPLLGQAVLVQSADGYKVAFGLAEFDDDYAARDILLADKRNGQPLDAKLAPYRLVVPQEGRQGRWARMVTSISVIPLADR